MTKAKKLKAILRQLVREYAEDGIDPKEINNGYCADFAFVVWERFGKDPQLSFKDNGYQCGYGHTWLSYKGRHYDAEAINGVVDPKELPFSQRIDDPPETRKVVVTT